MDPMTWWDWLVFSPDEIRDRGLVPKQRFEKVGHKRALSKTWSLTVGHWALTEARDIIELAGMDYRDTTARRRYDQFKNRWRVKTKRQTSDLILHNPEVSARVALAEDVYSDMTIALTGAAPVMKRQSFGEAAAYASKLSGVLPIEATLYYRGLLAVCRFWKIDTVAQYAGEKDRDNLWLDAGVDLMLPHKVMEKYADE